LLLMLHSAVPSKGTGAPPEPAVSVPVARRKHCRPRVDPRLLPGPTCRRAPAQRSGCARSGGWPRASGTTVAVCGRS